MKMIKAINSIILTMCFFAWLLFFTNFYSNITGIQQLNAYYWIIHLGK